MEGVQFKSTVLLKIIFIFVCTEGASGAYYHPDGRIVNPVSYSQYVPSSRNIMQEGLKYAVPARNVGQDGFQFAPTSSRSVPVQEFNTPDHVNTQGLVVRQDHIQPVLHRAASHLHPPVVPGASMDFNSILDEALEEEDQSRAAKSGYEYSSHAASPTYPQAPSYGYSQASPNYSPPPASSSQYTPAAPVHQSEPTKFSILKPDLTSLIKPATTKVATKVSGLLGLLLSLLTGSSPEDLELKGFKDLVINGIVKPLLIAKGGLKSLISKLTIPLISLLLINLEVLVTVWWLWEDCPTPGPEPVKPPYTYDKPGYTHNYNSY